MGHRRPLLAAVAEVAPPLQPLELAEGGGGVLQEAGGEGAGLLRPGQQDGVAAQHHRLVLHLVPVDPGEDLGPVGVGGAVGDAVEGVEVAGHAPGDSGILKGRKGRKHTNAHIISRRQI
uniref:Uncharacterized protein n=1 Tax=Denticeps clupeoides TaxID=299321 RepID=A0AAY4CWJ2_9TELE